MYDTTLIFRFRKSGSDRFFYTGKSIRTNDQSIFYTPVFQFVHNRKPVFGTFIITYWNGKNLFFSFHVDAKNHISSKFADNAIITNRVMDRINVENRIHLI